MTKHKKLTPLQLANLRGCILFLERPQRLERLRGRVRNILERSPKGPVELFRELLKQFCEIMEEE